MSEALPHLTPIAPCYKVKGNIPEDAIPHLLTASYIKKNGTLLYVARDDRRMAALAEGLLFFNPDIEIVEFPAWDCLPYDRVSPGAHITSQRLHTLCRLAQGNAGHTRVVITTINALLQRVPPKSVIETSSLSLKKGDSISREALIDFLMQHGYTRSATANDPGEFALRGSIIDIFPSGEECGYRLDFFGDTLDQLRSYDPITQVSQGVKPELSLIPASELLREKESVSRFRSRYRALFGAVTGDDPLYRAISEGRHYPGQEHWLPLFYEEMQTLYDYLPPDTSLCFEHLVPEAVPEREALIKDHAEARKEAIQKGFSGSGDYHPIPSELLYLSEEEWAERSAVFQPVLFSPFKQEGQESPYTTLPNFALEAKTERLRAFDLLQEYLAEERVALAKKHQKKVPQAVIACWSEGSRERVARMCEGYNLPTLSIGNSDAWRKLSANTLGLVVWGIERGFGTEEVHFISEQDVLGERIGRPAKKSRSASRILFEAASLSEGDLVVHKEYGIGRFEALETLAVAGEKHDCLRILYEGGDKLYVPVENIDLLSRYGQDEEGVRLDRLGTIGWQTRKAKMKDRLKMMAEALLSIAAARLLKKAPFLEPLKGLYEEFCARFPYAETEDQLRSIEDVAADLTSGRPMDRLICGDVGFGKTEVALRAAFIAASSQAGVQVAIICPTTLLCRQHYQTFRERFDGMPFEIKQLSRMVPAHEASKTKKALEEGRVDIVIGTHALISKSIKFKKLGLVIVDEEQLFGVKQKERFKEIRNEVHMLSLSATPIPRTMQMSLSGIKEMSLIATPPVDRLAVRTFVMPFDPVVVRDALLREHYRGGSSFFVVPRILDLDEMEPILRDLVPELRIGKAHGQMSPSVLDDVMNAFYDKKIDLLLSTNIVGSGLDVRSANTIFVHRADRFGLGQLYQLRGRVGRGKVRGYCYLTYKPKTNLSKDSSKRLEIMNNLDTLGAGFTVASHDMDIRGFGNLLGEEQSGQIREVGVELYQDMLKTALERAREMESGQEATEEEYSPQINIGISVLIPDRYIEDLDLRMSIYRQISTLASEEEVEAQAAELIDRFGSLPPETANLLEIVKLKLLCRQGGVEKLEGGPKGIVISFHNGKFKNPAALIDVIAKNPVLYKIKPDNKLVIQRSLNSYRERLETSRNSLEMLINMCS